MVAANRHKWQLALSDKCSYDQPQTVNYTVDLSYTLTKLADDGFLQQHSADESKAAMQAFAK